MEITFSICRSSMWDDLYLDKKLSIWTRLTKQNSWAVLTVWILWSWSAFEFMDTIGKGVIDVYTHTNCVCVQASQFAAALGLMTCRRSLLQCYMSEHACFPVFSWLKLDWASPFCCTHPACSPYNKGTLQRAKLIHNKFFPFGYPGAVICWCSYWKTASWLNWANCFHTFVSFLSFSLSN